MLHHRSPRRCAPALLSLLVLVVALCASPPRAAAQGTTIGFEEDFALAEDRAAVLGRLVPGTEDFYWFHCLHAQHIGDLDAVPPLLVLWRERHGRTDRYSEIEQRQALLSFDRDPEGTYEHLVRTLGLLFEHRQEIPGSEPGLAKRLDPTLLSQAALVQSALARHGGGLSGFKDAYLDEIATGAAPGVDLDERRLSDLLERLKRADLPGLPALVVRQLDARASRGFGSFEVHRLLTLAQLEECAALRPALLEDRNFVDAVLIRLAPAPDADRSHDLAARRAHLERLEDFTRRLAPTFNSLKAQILYHRLALDLSMGIVEADRLRAYLALPRLTVYTPETLRNAPPRGVQLVDANAAFATGLAPIGDDEALVRACLAHVLREADSYAAYSNLVDRRWLERLFAETKILAGIGDMERWYTLLGDPAYYEHLEKRVDLQFPRTQPRWFATDAPVRIELDVKNVETLIVRVFELDALAYYTSTGREIPASIELDGLVATSETTHRYDEPPLRRVRRSFDFPELTGPGNWVIEFIGNGSASRVLVRKGQLALTERVGAAGHVFRVHDETGARRNDATILFAGRRYDTDDRGEITLPFTTNPGRRSLIVSAGERTSLANFEHLGERYELAAGFFVERESLTTLGQPRLLVRTRLFVNNHPASLQLLEDPVLNIVAHDHWDVETTLEVRGPTLLLDEEFVQELAVPEGLARLQATLSARVASAIGGSDSRVSVTSPKFELNGIETTAATGSALLGRTNLGYHVDLVGRNGEPRADRPITVVLTHRDFTDPIEVELRSADNGRVELGPLPGIVHVATRGGVEETGEWDIDEGGRSLPTEVRAVAGETLRVPYTGAATEVTRDAFSLVSLRSGVPYADAFEHLTLSGGHLVLEGLEPGDHRLRLEHERVNITVRIVDGQRVDGFGVAPGRLLQLGPLTALTIESLTVEGDELVVRLAGANQATRVHIVATRYAPHHDALSLLDTGVFQALSMAELVRPFSDYQAERDIGDELRYILERRLARVLPGNMLRRPSLLVNPWDVGEISQSVGEKLSLGGPLTGLGGGAGGRSGGRRAGGVASRAQTPVPGADLDFLGRGAVLIANQRPSADSSLRVPLEFLGGNQHVHVIVIDTEYTIEKSIALEETPLDPVDQRLAAALDTERMFGERRSIETVSAGARTTINDVQTSTFKTYESLRDVFTLYRTLGGGAELARFEFMLRWPDLSDAEQRTLYSQHACHELHLFLHQKDRAYFDAVVRPHLANKLLPTFIDEWLLERDLTRHLEPRAFAQLNVVERILLGRRIADQSGPLARHVAELLALVPPEELAEMFEVGFGVAILSEALSGKMRSAPSSGGDKVYRGPGDTVPPRASAGGPPPPSARPSGDLTWEANEADGAVERARSVAQDGEAEVFFLDELADERQNLDADLARRVETRALFREVEPTSAFAESTYWKRRIVELRAELVTVNRFWLDLARTPAGQPFLSTHFAAASSHVNEMLLALALLDLPFEAQGTTRNADGQRLTLTSTTPLLIVRRDLGELPTSADAPPVLVSQDFFRHDERLRFDGTRMVDAFVQDEFLVDTAYGCRVVVTNPTSSSRELELLVQIPAGSIPMGSTPATRGVPVRLEPYGTTTVEYAFYFPAPGTFSHYPVVVAENEHVVAAADPFVFDVLMEPTRVDTASWEYVSQRGTLPEVLDFLSNANVELLDLSRIAWRLRDRATFDAVLDALRARFVYEDTLWSYGLVHRDRRSTSEFLAHQNAYLNRCGPYLESPLVTIDPYERRAFEHLEYEPLVNARAHRVSGERVLLNKDIATQYVRFLDILSRRPRLDDTDLASATYHLLLQDRVEDAIATHARIDSAGFPAGIQYDYLTAYLDFFTDDHTLARGIAEQYADHPVEHWRKRFAEIVAQLDESAGRRSGVTDPKDASQRQTDLAATEPALDFVVEGRRGRVTFQNLLSCEVSYFPMDIEVLFSTNPFVEAGQGAFAYVVPKRKDTLQLSGNAGEATFELPAEFRNSNVLVEVRSGALVQRRTVFAGSLAVQWIENYGQVRVTRGADGAPLSKVYVKVFARDGNGRVRFHKDGYTDLRGRFDYASLSGEGAGTAVRYAVLVLSNEEGAVVREVAPPAR